jgi:hypothetical protein
MNIVINALKLTLSQKRKLKHFPIGVEPHGINSFIVYRPKLGYFLLAVGLLMLAKIQQKQNRNFQTDI